MLKRLFKKYWWVLLIALAAGVAFWFIRHSAKKKEAAAVAEQRRVDSLTIRARYLDSITLHQVERIQALEANQQLITDAIAHISTERKKENHAYHKNLSTVRALPATEQVKLLADWLPKADR